MMKAFYSFCSFVFLVLLLADLLIQPGRRRLMITPLHQPGSLKIILVKKEILKNRRQDWVRLGLLLVGQAGTFFRFRPIL